MSARNGFEQELLLHIFQNNAIADIGDTPGLPSAATDGSLYVALYTTAPTESSSGIEAAYTSYARVAVARTSSGWTVTNSGDTWYATNTSEIAFPTNTGTTQTIVGFGICKTIAGDPIIYGSFAGQNVDNGDTPKFAANNLVITLD